MGKIQKSSINLIFNFMLALAIGVFINASLSTSSSAASTTTYTRMNNTTIKMSTVDTTILNTNPFTDTYYVADSLIPPNVKFWSIKAASGACTQQWIDMSTGKWLVHNIREVQGTCLPDSASPITVDNTGAKYYFFKDANGVIHPALKTSSDTEFTKIPDTKKLWSGSTIYIQTKPVQTNDLGNRCPRLLIEQSANRWEFVAPVEGSGSVGSAATNYYSSIVDSFPATKGTGANCDVGDIHAGKTNAALALNKIIGGGAGYWGESNGFNFTSFNAIKGNVEILGNAVGTVTAAELRLGTQASGSILPSTQGGLSSDAKDKKATTCAIDGIGWIICPVMNFMGKVVDGSYGVVDGLLKTPPMSTNTTDPANGTYQAWAIMRNIANVAFVIAFLIIIFSQITSVGITNYGVKKMLPRLIIAAILVNVSYFVCVIAVDISNILGSSMKQVFDNIGHDLKISTTEATFPGAFTTGTGWQGIVGFLLAGTIGTTIVLYAGMSVLLPALIAAVLAIVTVFLVLTMRQALLIIIIVISPLAFVAYLLPNTEEWFKKWRKLFQSLLLMYPVIAVLFGGSALASQVITASDKKSFAVQVMGALVAILPLFLTVTIMKGASSMFGKVGGFVSNNGMVNKAKKGAEGYRTNRQEYRKLKSMNGERSLPGTGWAAKRRTSREAVLSNRKSELNKANAAFVANRVQTDEGFKAQLAAGGGNGAEMRALAGAISVKVELSAKEVKAASAVIEDMNLDSKQLGELAAGGVGKSADGRTLNGGDDAVRKAAIMGAVSIGTVGDVEEIIKSSGTMSQEQRKILSSSIASSGITNKATHLAGQTLDDIAQGNVTSEDDLNFVTARAIEGGKYSSDKIGDNDHASLKRVVDVLGQARSDISTESRDSVGVQTTLAMTDNRKGRLTKAQMPYLDVLKR